MVKLKNAGNENLNITIFLLLYGTILKNIINFERIYKVKGLI